MSKFREELIRNHFELHRDLTWFETLEPRFKEHGLDASAMKQYREAWNAHAEQKDWPWWRNQANNMTDLQLDNERMDCVDKLDALGLLQWQRNNAKTGARTLQEIVNDVGGKDEQARKQVQSPTKEREM